MSNEPNFEDVIAALNSVKSREGQPALRKILVGVGGVTAASDLDPKHFADVIAACEGKARASVKPDGSLNHESIIGKWNASGGRLRTRATN